MKRFVFGSGENFNLLTVNVSPDSEEEERILDDLDHKIVHYNEFGKKFYLISPKDYHSICKTFRKKASKN